MSCVSQFIGGGVGTVGTSPVGGGGLTSGGDAGGKSCPATGQIRVKNKKKATKTLVCCPAAMDGRTFTPRGQVLLQVAPVSTVVDALVVTHQAEGDALPIPAVKVGLAAAL